jgi:ribosome-binding factor A
MALHSRIKRINEELRSIIAEIIQNEIKDPRLTDVMLTVTAVNATKDLSQAQVFVSVLGDDAQTADAMKALDQAKSFIRRECAAQTTFRHMPEISFRLDETGRNADRINTLLRKIEHENPTAFEGSPAEPDGEAPASGQDNEDEKS